MTEHTPSTKENLFDTFYKEQNRFISKIKHDLEIYSYPFSLWEIEILANYENRGLSIEIMFFGKSYAYIHATLSDNIMFFFHSHTTRISHYIHENWWYYEFDTE